MNIEIDTELNVNTLKASLLIAPKNDVRYCLNGVLLDFRALSLNIVATTGHLLSAYSCLNDTGISELKIIVPTNTLKTALSLVAKKKESIALVIKDGVYRLGDMVFEPAPADYPNYSRVIPTVQDIEPTINSIDPALLVLAEKALNIHYGNSPNAKGENTVTYRGNQESVMVHRGDDQAVVVVMPRRVSDKPYKGFAGLN